MGCISGLGKEGWFLSEHTAGPGHKPGGEQSPLEVFHMEGAVEAESLQHQWLPPEGFKVSQRQV